ncbi:MAG: glycosyl transferase family protein, partial [Methylococcales bacterium]|nr:glycosyl transferase family protein [Methylococcales bacterium]
EIAGFVRACQSAMDVPKCSVDLDWSSYAGKRRYLPWYILSALMLAENGISTFMHGASGHTAGRIYTQEVLPLLGVNPCASLHDAAESLGKTNFAFVQLENILPKLEDIIQLRPLIGLRSPVHSIARQINPFNAPYIMQGIFHPGYRQVHQESALLLGQNNMCVIKGEGGEIERNPDVECFAQSVIDGELVDETWPPLFKRRHVKDDEMDIHRLPKIWSGEETDEHGEMSIVATAALALKLMKKADTQESALAMAQSMWDGRDKSRHAGS